MENGFYKYENGVLSFAEIGIYTPAMTYLVSQHNNYTYPIDGWYYCNSFQGALDFFGLEVRESGELSEIPIKVWQVRQLMTKYVLKSDLSEDEYVNLISIYPEWAAGEDLTEDQLSVVVRTYNGKLYELIQPHSTEVGWTPDTTPALWKEIPPPGVIPDFIQPTGAHDAYNIGDKVRFAGSVYESLIDANVYSPTAYPQGWKKL